MGWGTTRFNIQDGRDYIQDDYSRALTFALTCLASNVTWNHVWIGEVTVIFYLFYLTCTMFYLDEVKNKIKANIIFYFSYLYCKNIDLIDNLKTKFDVSSDPPYV